MVGESAVGKSSLVLRFVSLLHDHTTRLRSHASGAAGRHEPR